MNDPITILIADDHPLFRSGLREVLAADPDLEVVAEVGEGRQALDVIRSRSPMMAILDIDMPKASGLQVAREIREGGLDVDVIVLTMHRDEALFYEAMDAGALAYVLKDSAAVEILKAVHTVAEGGRYISPALSVHLVGRSGRAETFLREGPSLARLTPAEMRVLRMVAELKTSREIAEALGISTKTVENHRTAVAAKLHLRGSASLLKFAIAHRERLSSG